MSARDSTAPARLSQAVEQRTAHAGRLHDLVPDLASAAAAIAERIRAGGMVQVTGTGLSAIDARHVVVEFLRPVTAGARAVPALTLDPFDRAGIVDGSVVIGLRLDDDAAVRQTLAAAHARGCLAVDLHARAPAAHVDVVLDLDTALRLVARELQVTTYHLLWELVQDQLDGVVDLRDATIGKIDESMALRTRVLEEAADTVQACAAVVAGAPMVWTMGNGGSATDASAIAHLLQDADEPGRSIRARALNDDVATLTALADDVCFEEVFAHMIRTLARPGDVVIGLSTSGGSTNVLGGLVAARQQGCHTIGLAGDDGGQMAALDELDHCLVVPSSSVHRVQEAQTTLAHVVVEWARSRAATTAA